MLGINLFGWRWSFVAFAMLGVLSEATAFTSHEGDAWTRILLRPQTLLLMAQYFCWSYICRRRTDKTRVRPPAFPSCRRCAAGRRVAERPPAAPDDRIACFAIVGLLLALPHIHNVAMAVAIMAAISFCGDVTVPISWNGCVEIGRRYTAHVRELLRLRSALGGRDQPPA